MTGRDPLPVSLLQPQAEALILAVTWPLAPHLHVAWAQVDNKL